MVAVSPTYAPRYDAKHREYGWDIAESHMSDLASEEVDWHLCPDGSSYLFLNTFLTWKIFSGGQSSAFSRGLLEVAHQRVKDAEARNQFETSDSSIGFPSCRRRHLQSSVWIQAFAANATLDEATVLRLAADARTVAAETEQRRWDGQPQSNYLDVIFLLLLVDAYDEAEQMVRAARAMKALHVKELFAVCKAIVERRQLVRDDLELRNVFLSSFDALRNPDYDDHGKGHLGALHHLMTLACVWQKYFLPGEGAYDLEAAVALVRA